MGKTIDEIISADRPIGEIITDLKRKDITIPVWGDLEKEYNPKKHPVMTDASYQDITKKGGQVEKVTRITLSLQKLATKRMTQLCFGIPVKRVYKATTEGEKRAAKILEKILLRNRIDSLNIDRGVMLFGGCEFATLWFGVKEENYIYGEKSAIKLRCKNYSPMNGDTLFPLFDYNDDLIALSFGYIRTHKQVKTEYFDTYTKDKHIQWKCEAEGVWEEVVNEAITLLKIPAVYCYRPTPIWEDTSNDVYEIEWTLSRNGNYIRKNAKPIFALFADEEVQTGGEKDNESKTVVQYPKGASASYITWTQATESLKMQIENLYRAFFTQLQLPDTSFDTMKTAPMSGEARKLMFIDSQLKVVEERGRLIETLDREINVVKAFMKVMFSELTKDIDTLTVETIITPFSITDDKETITNIMTGTGGKPIISQAEGVQYLGWSSDIEATLKQLQDEAAANAMNPTM